MKMMIVSDQRSFRDSIAEIIKNSIDDVHVILTEHRNALVRFMGEDPKVVLVYEYDEGGPGIEEWNQGRVTFESIRGSANKEVKIIRFGFSDYSYEDYIKAPFKLSELIEKLELTQ